MAPASSGPYVVQYTDVLHVDNLFFSFLTKILLTSGVLFLGSLHIQTSLNYHSAGIFCTCSFLVVQCGSRWEIYIQRYVWLVRYHRSECSCGQPRSVTHHQMKRVSSALSSHVVLCTLLLLLLLLMMMMMLWSARWCRLLTAATAQIARRTCANLYAHCMPSIRVYLWLGKFSLEGILRQSVCIYQCFG